MRRSAWIAKIFFHMAQGIEHRAEVFDYRVDPSKNVETRIGLVVFNFARMLQFLSSKTRTNKWVGDMFIARKAAKRIDES